MSERLAHPRSSETRASDEPVPDEAELRRLFREAGPRPAAPEPELSTIRAAFREEWEGFQARRRPSFGLSWATRPGWTLAAAAGALLVALAVAGWWLFAGDPRTVEAIARVEVVSPGVSIARGEGRPEPVLQGMDLLPGDRVVTQQDAAGAPFARAALRLASGISVRLDASSRLRLLAPDVVELERGALYVDAELVPASIEVRTPIATVRDVGTQFEVRLLDGALLVRVRRGEVSMRSNTGDASAIPVGAGEEVVLQADGTTARAAVPCRGALWAWAEELAPALPLEGRFARELLEWIARETCAEVRYADPAAAEVAARAAFRGPATARAPDESATRLLPVVGLDARWEDGSIVVSRPGTPPR
jgi:transmembrane sensor